jgi:hypothetical protein
VLEYYESQKEKYKEIVEELEKYLKSGLTLDIFFNVINADYYVHYFPSIMGQRDNYSSGQITDTYKAAYDNVYTQIDMILEDFSSAIKRVWRMYGIAQEELARYKALAKEERAKQYFLT